MKFYPYILVPIGPMLALACVRGSAVTATPTTVPAMEATIQPLATTAALVETTAPPTPTTAPVSGEAVQLLVREIPAGLGQEHSADWTRVS